MTFFRLGGRGVKNFTSFMTVLRVRYERWNKGSSKVEMSACLTLIFISSNTLNVKLGGRPAFESDPHEYLSPQKITLKFLSLK